MAKQPDLGDYVEVADRIKEFKEKYPDGCLQTIDWSIEDVDGQSYVIYRAAAFRDPADLRPGHGIAWEKVPGTTPYTNGSELMNAETAAWGRACVAVGIPAKKIASADEVRNRTAEQKDTEPERPAAPVIPVDRAKAILETAQAAKLAEGTQLAAVLVAKLTELGVETGKLGHLNVDQAEALEAWIEKETAGD